MDNKTEIQLDQLLDGLGRDAAKASPRPGADLVARVLADAAAVAPPPAPSAPIRASSEARFSLGAWVFGWGGGAVAALCLCLALGIGVGMSLEADSVTAFGGSGADIAMAGDDSLFSEEFL